MSERTRELSGLAKAYFEAGDKYPDMCRKLGDITLRHLRRLLATAGVERPVGRPRKPDAKSRRVSLDALGIA